MLYLYLIVLRVLCKEIGPDRDAQVLFQTG